MPGMNGGRWFEFPITVKSVEGGKPTGRQSDGLHRSAPISSRLSGGRASHSCAQAKPRIVDINLMLEIIVRNFTLRTCHGGSDRHAHRVEIETFAALLFHGAATPARLALDILEDDCSGRAASRRTRDRRCASARAGARPEMPAARRGRWEPLTWEARLTVRRTGQRCRLQSRELLALASHRTALDLLAPFEFAQAAYRLALWCRCRPETVQSRLSRRFRSR